MSGKKIAIGVVAVVAAGAAVAGGVAAYNKYHPKGMVPIPSPLNRARAVMMAVPKARVPVGGIAWADPSPASRAWSATACTRDSLGDIMCPEKWEWEGGQRDLCAWKGCNGEVDSQGRCTGCPPM